MSLQVASPGVRAALPRASAVPRAATDAADIWPHTDRLLPWGVAGFITMLMLVPFDAISLPITLPMDAKLDRPVLAVLAGLWLLSCAAVTGRARPGMRLGPAHAAVAVFFAVCVSSVALNAGVLAILNEQQLAVKKLVLLGSFVLAFMIVTSVVRPNEVRNFTKLILWLGGILAVLTIWEYRMETNVFYDWGMRVLPGLVAVPPDLHEIDPTGRTTVYGPMGHPLELALVIGLVVPLALVPTLQATERGQRWKWIALTGLLLAALFSTQRKTGMLAVGAGVLLVLIYRRELVRKMFPLLIGLMLVMHVLAPGAMGSLKQQLQPGHLTTASSNKQRSDDYTAVAPDLHKHLALGRGFGSYDGLKYRILDNQYLGLLIMVGIIGTVAYVAMYVAGVVGAHRYARMRGSPHGATMLALSAALTTFLVGSVLFDVLSFSHVTYMSFVVLGLAAVGARADAPGGPEDPAARSSEPGRWSRR
jgi:hypothetical protein